MVRPGISTPVCAPALPDGFGYKLFVPGDGLRWSAIEAAVHEFESQADALAHFNTEFLPYEGELTRRMAFITNADSRAVADATAWWLDDDSLGRVALLHWVAVMPSFQGMGLGRAVTCKALSLFPAVGPSGDIWLTTQTWSHVAIGLYLSLGFAPHRSIRLGGHANGYEGAARVLREVMPPETYARFIQATVG